MKVKSLKICNTFAIKERKREKWINIFKGKLAVSFPTSPLISIANINHVAKSLQEAISEAIEEIISQIYITHKSVIW
jgi:hypothetical protein